MFTIKIQAGWNLPFFLPSSWFSWQVHTLFGLFCGLSCHLFFSGATYLSPTFTSFTRVPPHLCWLASLPSCIAPVARFLTAVWVFSPGIPTGISAFVLFRNCLQCFLFLCLPAVNTFWVVLLAAFADCLLRTDSACCCCEGFVLLGLPLFLPLGKHESLKKIWKKKKKCRQDWHG